MFTDIRSRETVGHLPFDNAADLWRHNKGLDDMHRLRKWLALGFLSLCLGSANAAADEILPAEKLVGTIWASQDFYTWTNIDRFGKVDVYPTQGNYIEFLELNGGVLAFKIQWWNAAANLNVIEHGLMVQSGDNRFGYVEVEHPDAEDFPGMSGRGMFRILDENNAELSQLGHLADGTAAALTVQMTRVAEPPAPPIPVTYPAE